MILCLLYFISWINVIRSLLVSMDIGVHWKPETMVVYSKQCLISRADILQRFREDEDLSWVWSQCGWVQVVSRVELGLFRAPTAANLVCFFFFGWKEKFLSWIHPVSSQEKRCRHSWAVFWILTWCFSVEMPLLKKKGKWICLFSSFRGSGYFHLIDTQ